MERKSTYSLLERLLNHKDGSYYSSGILFKADGSIVEATPDLQAALRDKHSIYEADPFIGSLQSIFEHMVPEDAPVFFPRVETAHFGKEKGVYDYSFYAKLIDGQPYILCTINDTSDQNYYLFKVQSERNKALIEKELQELQKTRNQQKENIRKKIEEIQQQKNLAEAEKRKIIESLSYAQRIQEALLPSQDALQQMPFPFFVFWQPCDLISGDFYYLHYSEDFIYVILGDCTGHGVPGGILTSIGIMALRQALILHPDIPPHELIRLIDENIHSLFDHTQNSSPDKVVRDGMELAVLRIHRTEQYIEYAGAGIPLYLLHEGKVSGHTPQQAGINNIFNNGKGYKSEVIPYQKGDEIILSTDGYIDQIGFVSNRRFKRSRFIKLVERLAGKPFNEHKEHVKEAFYQWKGNQAQIDDVLVLGIQLL
ncbi:MAG: hypothetical protein KatS3mg033_0162 [Thermonema sp.]|uniref:PP2C family protein-serine/threonine phosphatase n=1 Tax=Thermonema sp. TaxID=2231181 RepID=UPI0021DD4AD4|nr:SpoIIE family protein phosphatase [Thermonema sp.]GIV38362.1 MAG: hypothetical protein KatS3mg033_0162 [Thermonema sp.]